MFYKLVKQKQNGGVRVSVMVEGIEADQLAKKLVEFLFNENARGKRRGHPGIHYSVMSVNTSSVS